MPFFFLLPACSRYCLDYETDDVVKIAKHTYIVSALPDHYFGNQVKTSQDRALAKASAYCHSKGRQILVTNIDAGYRSEVTFRCLEADDPGLR